MKKLYLLPVIVLLFVSCRNNSAPDVSSIPVEITIDRFDKAFFEKADTNQMSQYIAGLQAKFPYFTNDFLEYILGLPAEVATDSAFLVFNEIKRFYRLTAPLYDSIAPRFENIKKLEKNLQHSFQYVKYYFPAYQVPKIITYLGPFDAPGVATTNTAIAIGLQLFAGKDFSFYNTMEGQQLYPGYISRHFEPPYIPANVMKAVIEDIYPDNSKGRPLIEQIIEKGKQWYLLDKFLPDAPDSLKTGYTQQQLKWCDRNEGLIWNFILQNTDIYTTDPGITKSYIGDAPSTDGMPDASPGNIGQWIGWKIVTLYAEKHPDLTAEEITKTAAKKLFTDAKYKPK